MLLEVTTLKVKPMQKTSFLPNPTLDATLSVSHPSDSQPRRESVKILIIGSPQGVKHTIYTLYCLGFAPVTAWSPPQPTANPGEVASLLVRPISIA